jgi:LuxR family transcriptional regulator, maltose regulon positive regulatory protein
LPGEAGPGEDVRATGLMHLGIVELWSIRFEEAGRHLEQGLRLARLAGRPYLEVQCLAYVAVIAGQRSQARAREHALEAIAIAEARGWGADRAAGPALVVLAAVDVWQGRFEDAEDWLERADRLVRSELEPATRLLLHLTRGRLHAARGRPEEAAAAFRAAAQIEAFVAAPPMMTGLAQTQLQLGDAAAARATLAELPEEKRNSDTVQTALA